MSTIINSLNNFNILVVDDTRENLDVLTTMLESKGYEVRPVPSGKLALRAIKSKKPDLILLDINMPGMNGYQVCKTLKSDIEFRDIPVIFISALTETIDKVKAFSLGGVDYITKPFEFEELHMRVETHLKLYSLMNDLNKLVTIQVKEISDSHIGTIAALAKLTQTRDDDTGKHIERIKLYCKLLATELSRFDKYSKFLSESQIDAITQASVLHDIGKVGIPDEILLKPGKLTDEEFEIMKTHTTIGAQTLEEVMQYDQGNSFINIGIELARHHHERWDGRGYPDGLSGKDIPLAARIMSIADVYDALKTKRCYKPAFSHEESCKIIEDGSGTQFDPEIVSAFLAVSDQILKVWESMT